MELEADSRYISTPLDEACAAEIPVRAGPAFVSETCSRICAASGGPDQSDYKPLGEGRRPGGRSTASKRLGDSKHPERAEGYRNNSHEGEYLGCLPH